MNSTGLTFGEAALALDIGFQLLLDVLVIRHPEIGVAMLAELDVLLDARLPTPGTHTAIERMREHVAGRVRTH